MITFSEIYEAMRKEKYSEQLQKLPKKFLIEASDYFRELLRTRKKKILNLAFVASEVGISKRDFENLLGFEKDLFEEVVKDLEKAEKNLAIEMEGGQKDEMKHRLLRILEDGPEFLDFEGKENWPVKKGEIANLERELVEVFGKDSRVEVVEEG